MEGPRQERESERSKSWTHFSDVAASAASELVMTLEMMVMTVEAKVVLIFATFTSCFTFVTTLDTWRETEDVHVAASSSFSRVCSERETPTSSLDSSLLVMTASCTATSAAFSASNRRLGKHPTRGGTGLRTHSHLFSLENLPTTLLLNEEPQLGLEPTACSPRMTPTCSDPRGGRLHRSIH